MTNYYNITTANQSTYQHVDADGLDAASGPSVVYVAAGAEVYGLADNANSSKGLLVEGTLTATIDGTVSGAYCGILSGAFCNNSVISIGSTGVVQLLNNNGINPGAINLMGDSMRLSNAGHIYGQASLIGDGCAIENSGYADGGNSLGIGIDGINGSITNTGTIFGGSSNGGALFYGAVDMGDDLGTGGANNTLENDGTISGLYGVTYYGTDNDTMSITNHGSISSAQGVAIYARPSSGGEHTASAASLELVNTGTISSGDTGNTTAILLSGGFDTIENSGTISAANGFYAIQDVGGTLDVVNSGTIVGGIFDCTMYDGTQGSITGAVNDTAGDDVFTGGQGSEDFELASGGNDQAFGNGGNDTIEVAYGGLSKRDVIDGGDGNDTLSLFHDDIFSPRAFAHVTSIETVVLGRGGTVVLSDGLVTSANSHTLTVYGQDVEETIDASHVSSATNHVIFDGRGGGDIMTASAGADTFFYDAASDSTSNNFDVIHSLNFAKDVIDLPDTAADIAGINTALTKGTLNDTNKFDGQMASALKGHLTAHHAILFTPNAGDLKGDTFLVVDLNGTAGYQGGHDLVIELVGATGTLAVSDFI